MDQLLTKGIWAAAVRERKEHDGPVTVAVAYATADLLGLRAGDTLLCDASRTLIESGATTAEVLADLHTVGVKVYNVPGLHAKLIRLPAAVIVGSSNMTTNTGKLSEAALFTRAPAARDKADRFVEQLKMREGAEELNKALLKDLLAIEVVRSGWAGGGTDEAMSARGNRASKDVRRMWVTAVKFMSASEADAVNEQIAAIRNDDQSIEGECVKVPLGSEMHAVGKVHPGDLILSVIGDRAYHPFAVRDIYSGKTEGRGNDRIFLGSAAGQLTRSWSSIRKILVAHGAWTRAGRPTAILVKGDIVDEILAQFRPRKRKPR